jgi:hypothetical protein
MDELPYREIPAPPEDARGATVMLRVVDGLGFRYRWATEGLRDEDSDFKPGADSMSLRELLHHVARLTAWLDSNCGGAPMGEIARDLPSLRAATLGRIVALRTRLLGMSDAQLAALHIAGTQEKTPLPFWNMLNGPLADALTHVGQINAWRRLAGNPPPRADVFRGRPPVASVR